MSSPRYTRPVVLAVVITALVAVAIGTLVFYQISPGAANSPLTLADAKQTVSVVNGQTIVTLDTAVQTQSGIQVEPLVATAHQTETTAYGTVLDLQPLIDLRTRYLSAQAEADAATAVAAATQKESERDRILYQDNQNVSLKTYQAAQAASLSDQAKRQAAAMNLQNIKGAALQQFGEVVGGWILDPHSPQLERLLSRKEILLRVTVPLGNTTAAPAMIQVATNEARRHPAYLVSPSPQSDPAVQGNGFIYRTAALIAAGTNVAVFLPTSGQTTQGIFISPNAIVWHGGEPWAYVQVRPDRFARRPVGQHLPTGGGFYVTDGFTVGERVVVRGAQLLLS